jgi:hypothetical protein
MVCVISSPSIETPLIFSREDGGKGVEFILLRVNVVVVVVSSFLSSKLSLVRVF